MTTVDTSQITSPAADTKPQVIVLQTQASAASPTADSIKCGDTKKNEDSSAYTYLFIAVLSVTLIVLLYYAYSRFVSNTVDEPLTKGNEQERDDPVIDFNLREAIKDLQNIQKTVLSTLSETSDF